MTATATLALGVPKGPLDLVSNARAVSRPSGLKDWGVPVAEGKAESMDTDQSPPRFS